MKIEYVTSNSGKFEEACHVLEGWTLEQVPLELEEIQGERHEIIKAKARQALRLLGRPLIVEDVCLCLDAIGGLPGPYIKEFLTRIGPGGIAELVHKYPIHTAQAICIAAYIEPGTEPVCFEGIIEGTIVKPRGATSHGALSWNPIFQPNGFDKTFGEMTMREISKVSMRRKALLHLKDYLSRVTG